MKYPVTNKCKRGYICYYCALKLCDLLHADLSSQCSFLVISNN